MSIIQRFATENYVNEKVAEIEVPVKSVNGETGEITLTANDVGAAEVIHTHNDMYYTEEEIDNKFAESIITEEEIDEICNIYVAAREVLF